MDLGQLNEPSPVLEGLTELLDFELGHGDTVDALDLEPALVDLFDPIAHERGVCTPVCSKCCVGSAPKVVRRCGSRLWLHFRARVSNNSCSFSTSLEGETAGDSYIREETIGLAEGDVSLDLHDSLHGLVAGLDMWHGSDRTPGHGHPRSGRSPGASCGHQCS